jgi:protein gp37
MATSIEWTDETWNPLKGCQRISPGCGGPKNEGGCYAERQAIRQAGPGGAYEGLVKSTPNGPRWTGKAAVDEGKLLEPLSWRKPRTVFVDSMSDLFFEGFTDEQVARAVATMAATPHITYQVLTKRAERMGRLLASESFEQLVIEAGDKLAADHGWCHANQGEAWPLPNVWWGVSCEDRKHGLPRLEHLRRTPAAVRFISFEPLLEDLGQVDLRGIQWAIIGGESGPRSRPCDVAWIRSLVAECRTFGVAPFVKQLGAQPTTSYYDHETREFYERAAAWEPLDWDVRYGQPPPGTRARLPLKHKKGGDPAEWPVDFPREFPEVRRAA